MLGPNIAIRSGYNLGEFSLSMKNILKKAKGMFNELKAELLKAIKKKFGVSDVQLFWLDDGSMLTQRPKGYVRVLRE